MIEALRFRSAETAVRCMHGNLFDEAFPCRMCVAWPERHHLATMPVREIVLVFPE
jgi:hypothetical protein